MDRLSFDSPEWRTLRDQKYLEWFLGNEYAVECALVLMNACELWDDLIDQDKEISTGQVHTAFTGIFVELTVNPFWQKSRLFLEPLIIQAINAWLDANELERASTRVERNQAFHLRNMPTELIPMIAFAVGGWEHTRRVSLEIRNFFTHESFDDWECGGEQDVRRIVQ